MEERNRKDKPENRKNEQSVFRLIKVLNVESSLIKLQMILILIQNDDDAVYHSVNVPLQLNNLITTHTLYLDVDRIEGNTKQHERQKQKRKIIHKIRFDGNSQFLYIARTDMNFLIKLDPGATYTYIYKILSFVYYVHVLI